MSMSDLSRAVWRKSTRSNAGGNCVEVASAGHAIAVRDSKQPAGAVLSFALAPWSTFVRDVKAGHHDLT